MMRVGEHNMFLDEGSHVDVPPEKIYFHPDRNRKCYTLQTSCTPLQPVRVDPLRPPSPNTTTTIMNHTCSSPCRQLSFAAFGLIS